VATCSGEELAGWISVDRVRYQVIALSM
jgi:hypothetical protein